MSESVIPVVQIEKADLVLNPALLRMSFSLAAAVTVPSFSNLVASLPVKLWISSNLTAEDGVRARVGLGLCLGVMRAEPAEILDLRPVVSMFYTYS